MVLQILAQEQMQEIASMVDMRFGHGTWRSIVDERAKRIREAKEAEAAARKAALQKQKEFEESLKQALMIGGAIIIACALFIFLFVTIAQATVLTLSIL
mgnify:CR=1 FL=1